MSGFRQSALALQNKLSSVTPQEVGDLTISAVSGDLIVNDGSVDKTIAYVEDISGGSGASYTWSEKTSNYTASAFDGILADTTSAAFTITLPSSPQLGDSIIIIDAKSNFEINNVTVTSTDNIQGASDDLVLDVNDSAFELVWSGATNGWMIKTFLVNGATPINSLNDLSDVTTTGATTGDVLTFNGAEWIAAAAAAGGGGGGLIDIQRFTASGTWTKPAGCERVFVICQGGGGGGAHGTGGGGGAGEYVMNFITSGLGSTETVTVGAGGNGRTCNTGILSGGTGGGSSSFGSHLSALGGLRGRDTGPGNENGKGSRGGIGNSSAGTFNNFAIAGAASANTGAGGGSGTCFSSARTIGGAGAAGYVIVMSFGE